MLIPFIFASSIKISHVASNQDIQNAPRVGNQFILYNQNNPSDAQNISTFEICDMWSRNINGVCVQCDTSNSNLRCFKQQFSSLCLKCTDTGCVQGYNGDSCSTCTYGYYQTYNGCAQCLIPYSPLYTFSTYIIILWLAFIGSGYAAHYSLLAYVVKSGQLFVALSSLAQTDLSWMVGLQTFVLDPLAVQWECFNIPNGFAPIMGLVMVGGFWVINIFIWGLIKLYILVLQRYFHDLSPPDMRRVKDATLGAWSFYIDWQFPILMYRFVQGIPNQWIPNTIGLVLLILIVFISYFGARRVQAIIFPGTIPFVRFGPSFYKLKPDYFHFYLFGHLWWAMLALNTLILHPYLQRIVIVVVLLSRSIMHFYSIFKRPVTWYGELVVLVFGMIWCFTVDKTYGYVVVILALIMNMVMLSVEISWCYQKKWFTNIKPEVVFLILT